ncbi:AraC-type DNA-binding protein [Kushneria avicenniae]|uniref:AraC-type DNA-binding protein n=1 Tax=Kushneria avicenniae TaxID=402385 RepID=A0A1I1K3F8_9GAMM|nr:AraC family transcriptional regulator [Kushneria avicenniae]SFC53268.1 AraC-type DNA-binding protein [Kushneria avicenniae]
MARHVHDMRFWRHPDVPWLEARLTRDARAVRYARHSHDTLSLGAVLGGHSHYEYRHDGREHVAAVSRGSIVAMNPGEIHACNPSDAAPWSYLMLYIDPQWLAARQPGCQKAFQPLVQRVSRDPVLYQALVELAERLFDSGQSPQAGEIEAVIDQALEVLGISPHTDSRERDITARAAAFIRQHCLSSLSLEQVAHAVGCSRFTLIRGFRRDYGITPHAFLIDCRIRWGQRALRRGADIAETALACRFADQAHFQRTFKKVTAATPRQYRRATSGPWPVHWPPAAPPSLD